MLRYAATRRIRAPSNTLVFGRDRQFSQSDNVAEVVDFKLEEFAFLQSQ